jgi:hypothetical protein
MKPGRKHKVGQKSVSGRGVELIYRPKCGQVCGARASLASVPTGALHEDRLSAIIKAISSGISKAKSLAIFAHDARLRQGKMALPGQLTVARLP